MDNSYSFYADSGDSSTTSREIDCENQSWEAQSSTTNYRVKFMCSYNGKIQPRPHDNHLTYVGGETKILAVDRNSKFVTVISKLSAICDFDIVNLKYQLPGEDLDALVSVTNDEDLELMMIEYDLLHRSSSKPARLRLFLFPVKSNSSSLVSSAKDGGSSKSDVLNSVQRQLSIDSDGTTPTACQTPTNPDFLFGLDNNNNNNNNQKGVVLPPMMRSPVKAKHDLVQEQQQLIQQQQLQIQDHNREDHRILVGEHSETQRQLIQELQNLQISNQEQQQQTLTRAFAGDYYVHQIPENTIPAGNIPVTLPPVLPPSVPVPAAAGGYLQERNIAPPPPPPPVYREQPVYNVAPQQPLQQQVQLQEGISGTDHQVYLIPTPTGYYQAPAPPQNVLQVPGQGYYAPPPPPPPVYREQPVYNVAPQQPLQQQVQPRIVALADGSYAQVGYDSAGRQVYYAPPKPSLPVGVMPSPCQTVANGGIVGGGGAIDLTRQQQQQPNLAANQEVKIPYLKPAQAAAAI